MVSFSTKEYYESDYLMGRQAVISTALIPYHLIRATQDIKIYTGVNVIETEPFSDDLQMCCCEVADCIYKSEYSINSSGIKSEKVGEYAITYEDKKVLEESTRIKIKSIVYAWLGNTALLYRGGL